MRGAAILMLSMELVGKNPRGTDNIVKDTLRDLGVTEKQVRRYINKHREELIQLLKERGIE